MNGEQLHALIAVRRPDTGQPLRRVGGTGTAVAAIDGTFSAPKSVSAAWALATPELREVIERAHETAIDRAIKYAIGQVPMLRRRVAQDTVVHEKAAGLVATSWRHTTARAVDAQVPDPQLHSHVLLHAGIRADGEFAAIDSRALLTHQRELGAAYRTELAHELHQAGFQVVRGTGRGGRYFELAGIPDTLIDRWSSRHHQVQSAITARLEDQERSLLDLVHTGGPAAADALTQLEVLRQTRQLSPRQERMMGTITRTAKAPVTEHDLDTAWQDTAREHGLTGQRVQVLAHAAQDELQPVPAERVLDALTKFDAVFPARDARAVALEQSAGVPIGQALEQLHALHEEQQILMLADGNHTTRAHRGKERTVVAIAERLAAQRVPPLPDGVASAEADRLDAELGAVGGRLSAEQRDAILLACGDRPLVIIEGQAGTGKSTTLTGIARAHRAAGRAVVVTSTAALAAQHLASELGDAGVECDAYSTAALHAAVTSGRVVIDDRTTIIHDEAALASTDEQLALLDTVETEHARLIAVGDPQQNQPVGAGGLWSRIDAEARDADAVASLTINQRARDAGDRRDQQLFREGHIERAVRGYAARGHVQFASDQRRAEDAALENAHADRTAGRTTLVIAQTSNEHLDQLNARAQAIRRQAGELGDDQLPVPGRPYSVHEGDEVQIRRTLPIDGRAPVRNGTGAIVAGVDTGERRLTLTLADESTVTLDSDQVAAADLRLGYVQHPFPAQGQTVDTAHLIVEDHATREGTYVALTRAREQTAVYAAQPADVLPGRDRLGQLADQVGRSEPEMPSIETPLRRENKPATRVRTREEPAAQAEQNIEHTDEREPMDSPEPSHAPTDRDEGNLVSRDAETDTEQPARTSRTWPRTRSDAEREPATVEADVRAIDDDDTPGFGW